VICILRKQRHPLGHPFFKVRMGSLYLDVDTVGKPFALLFTPLFLARRCLFALVAVVSDNVLVQLFVTIYASLGLVFFYATVWPMTDKVNNLMQLCNELFLLACVHFMLAFTDYTFDPFQRHQIGYAYLIFLAVNITVNVVLIGHVLVNSVKKWYRERKNKQSGKKKDQKSEDCQFNRCQNVQEQAAGG